MFDLIRNEWEKIPLKVRYVIEIGVALLFNTWALDHWLPNQELPYRYLWHLDLRELLYNLGQSFIFLGILTIIIRQLLNFPKLIFNYKNRYPIKSLGNKFDLVWFSGKLILFDHKDMRYYHVYPWETAEDLDFVSYGTHVQDHFPNPDNPIIEIGKNKKLETTKYKNGGSINTYVDVIKTERS